jgi:uncharacterized protein with FMN-binding domain
MKRTLLAIAGTIAGLVSLLSFKTSQPQLAAGPLPSAGAPAGAAASTSPASTSPRSSSAVKPGTHPAATPAGTAKSYLGSAVTTRFGVVQVRVTASGKHITNVAFVQLNAFDSYSQQLHTSAGPQLLNETLSAQSAHIQSVSGASYTSAGYKQSLQSALDTAGI